MSVQLFSIETNSTLDLYVLCFADGRFVIQGDESLRVNCQNYLVLKTVTEFLYVLFSG